MQSEELMRRFDSAVQRAQNGEYASALDEFEELERLSEHRQDIAALRFFQATCLTDMGRTDEALKRISRVDKNELAFSNQIDYEYERARIERTLGQKREALERTEATLKMVAAGDSRDIGVVTRNLNTIRGILLAELDRCDDAIPILQSVPGDDEGWVEARIRLGDCQMKKGWLREAVTTYSGILSGQRKVGSIHQKTVTRNIGCAYFYMGEYAKAIENLRKIEDSYEEAPDLKADLFGLLGSAYSHLGMLEEASKYAGYARGSKSVQ